MFVAAPEFPSAGDFEWKRKARWMGNSVDHNTRKRPKPVVNCSTVDARKGAEDTVNV